MGKGSGSLARRESGYPLVGNWVQAEIMMLARAEQGPVSRSKLTNLIGVSRSKVSMEVQRLLEAGLLAEDGLAESEGADAPRCLASRPRQD